MFYNPFEKITTESFKNLIIEGFTYYVIQRLVWPNSTNKWFLLSAYKIKDQAINHESLLREKEGKVLEIPRDQEKIYNLLNTGYSIFYGRMKEDWSQQVIRAYQKKIIAYLRDKTKFKRSDHIDILFTLEVGRPIAKITNGDMEEIIPAIELIK